MVFITRFILVLITVVLSGCGGTDAKRILNAQEENLDTDKGVTLQFHSTLYYPTEISLNFPGFIVGIEKSPVKDITTAGDVVTMDVPGSGKTAEEFEDDLVDKKIMYVSHIVENKGQRYGEGNCAHYSVYHKNVDVELIEGCDGKTLTEVKPAKAYYSGWQALENLSKRIKEKLKANKKLEDNKEKYTHILVISMGWNTDQEEAVRNFNSIVKSIDRAKGDNDFNPLFVGITWPSMWQSSWFDPILKVSSYPVKSTDADEVGISWMGAVIHSVLNKMKLATELPLVVIGHSFGARATSMATCVGPAIAKKDRKFIERNTIDLLVSLQGAYSMNRFFPENKRIEKITYDQRCANNAKQVVLTSSVRDTAMDIGKWTPFVGNESTYKKYCGKNPHSDVECVVVNPEGGFKTEPSKGFNFLYINADELIYYNAYKSGGGSHSDIYRNEMGKMLWQLISNIPVPSN